MKKVTAYVHSHWDREWYRGFEDFRLRLIEVLDDIFAALNKGELPCFYFDGQTAALEDYLEVFPERIDMVKKLIKEKKLRVGPFYCSADSFLVSGESLYRNLEIGIKKAKELGETDFIAYLADIFGYSRCIPYILKAFGIDKACLWRGLGNLPADINWDGIKVTYLIQGYFQNFLNSELPVERKAKLLKNYIDKIAQNSSDNILLPIGGDHLTIAKNLNNQINELNKIYNEYKIEIQSPFEYFEKIDKRKNVKGEFLDNSKNFILQGVYSSRINIKQANAYSQWHLTRLAEPIQALGHHFYNTKDKQNEIDYAYKTLIKNHAHDSIYGCCIDEVCDEIMIRYQKTDTVADGVINRTIRDLSSDNAPLCILNLSNFTYSGKVKVITDKQLPLWLNPQKISTGKGFTDSKLFNINEVPVTEDVTDINEYLIDVKNIKPFSLTKITEENICQESYIKTTKSSIENENIKAEIKNRKLIVTDKRTNEIYEDFIKITDRADIGDSYNFGALKKDRAVKSKFLRYRLKEENSKKAVLNLIYEIEMSERSSKTGRNKVPCNHKISIDLILYNNSEYLEFDINWLNRSYNHILQISFKLKEKIYSTINEDLFGTVERKFNPEYNIYEHIPAPKGVELKQNTSSMQRFMSTQNFALLTKGNCEYEVSENEIKLTILRATGIISEPENPLRGTPAGPPVKAAGLQCYGKNRANFAIAFTNREVDLFRLSEEFYSPCISLFTNHKDKQFFNKKNENQLVYAVKTENNNLLFRCFDIEKKEIKNIVINH